MGTQQQKAPAKRAETFEELIMQHFNFSEAEQDFFIRNQKNIDTGSLRLFCSELTVKLPPRLMTKEGRVTISAQAESIIDYAKLDHSLPKEKTIIGMIPDGSMFRVGSLYENYPATEKTTLYYHEPQAACGWLEFVNSTALTVGGRDKLIEHVVTPNQILQLLHDLRGRDMDKQLEYICLVEGYKGTDFRGRKSSPLPSHKAIHLLQLVFEPEEEKPENRSVYWNLLGDVHPLGEGMHSSGRWDYERNYRNCIVLLKQKFE